jgi:DNA helicase HerA-like ATPase
MRMIGRDESADDRGTGPVGHLGHYRARDGSRGERIGLDLAGPHVALVVGKRGSGKSYTLGVLAEALARTGRLAPVVADPMGVFGTLSEPADGEPVPATVREPRVRADALAPRGWCTTLGLDPTDGAGSLVWQAAETADTLAAMRAAIVEAETDPATRRAAANHLRLAESWDVFDPGGLDDELLDGDATVLDLAGLDRAPMNATLAAVARRLYDARVDGEDAATASETDRLPWLLVDEAHAFFDGVAASALRRLLTRGRQPGVSLVAATQQPSALPAVAVSQADLLVVHRLTSRADREALAAARPAYMRESIAERMPTDPGEALVIDDATESVHAIQVRERDTPHGGESPRIEDTPISGADAD